MDLDFRVRVTGVLAEPVQAMTLEFMGDPADAALGRGRTAPLLVADLAKGVTAVGMQLMKYILHLLA